MCPGLSVGVHGKTDQKAFWKEGSQSRVFGQSHGPLTPTAKTYRFPRTPDGGLCLKLQTHDTRVC